MVKLDFGDLDGVWRTIGGRRVFIREGESLSSAMKRSGKFKGLTKKGMETVAKNKEKAEEASDKLSEKEKLDKELEEKYGHSFPYHKETIEEKKYKEEVAKHFKDKDMKEEIRKAKEEGQKRYKEELKEKEQKNGTQNWQEQIKANNAKMEKDVTDLQNKINEYRNKSAQSDNAIEKYQYLKEADKLQDQYYERFRENERENAKIKAQYEKPGDAYIQTDAHAGYKEKFNNTWGEDGMGDKVVSAKMYTNDEFMEHLEDANWHGERRQLLDANLTNQELAYIKDRTKVSAWGVENLTGKEQVDKLIKEAKSAKAHDVDMSKTATNEYMNDKIRQNSGKDSGAKVKSGNNTIPRDYEKITYTQNIDTNAGKKGDKFELYKDEYGETHTKNLRTGETYHANMSMMHSSEAVTINDVVKKGKTNDNKTISQLNKEMLGDTYKGKGETPNLVYSNNRRIDIANNKNGGKTATIWKEGKIERKTILPENVTGDKTKDYFDKYLKDLDNSSNQINNSIRRKAYQKYMKEHPASKMSFEDFKDMRK